MRKKNIILAGALTLMAAAISACAPAGSNSNKKGLEAYQNGDYQNAVYLFKQAITQEPSEDAYYCNLGQAYCAQGYYEEAIESFTQALQLGGSSFYSYRGMGLAYNGLEEYEKAIESFQQAIEAAGSLDSSCRLDVVGYRAEAKMKLGDYEECLDIDNRNYEGYLTMADALKKAEAEEARKVVLNAALEVIPYEAKDWCYRGRIYLELEQTDEAFSAFEESYNKGYAQAGYYLGYCYELQGKSEEAINLYQEQIKHDPQDAGLYNQLSSCLVRQGEYQDALIMIQKGMQLADESQMADFLWNESICYEKMGNYDTAIEKLMSYLEQYPADKDAKKELAFLYSR